MTVPSSSSLRFERSMVPSRFLVNFRAFLSLEFRSSSITRLSYGENPATSRIIERTNLFLVDWMPFRWLGRDALGREVVGYPLFNPYRRLVRAMILTVLRGLLRLRVAERPVTSHSGDTGGLDLYSCFFRENYLPK